MKKIMPAFFMVLVLSRTACKDEKSDDIQDGELPRMTSTAPLQPEYVQKGDEEGHIAMRYSPEGVNKYQFADSLIGKWTGPEGTYLDIQRDGEEYKITIANLDGPQTYPATAIDEGISFERGGKTETIRSTDGEGTGMKYLAEKVDCVVVTAGSEGFCRD
jgi:hypothetical protein